MGREVTNNCKYTHKTPKIPNLVTLKKINLGGL